MNCVDNAVWEAGVNSWYPIPFDSSTLSTVRNQVRDPVQEQVESAAGIVVSRQLDEEADQ